MDGNLAVYIGMVAVGSVLGAIFFGGLWLTVQRMPNSKSPALLFLTSAAVRVAIVLAGIWFFAAGNAISIVCCLIGFIVVRLLVTHGNDQFASVGRERRTH